MPSQRPAGALLALATPLDDGEDDFIHYPWGWSAWQKRTGLLNTPFIPGLEFWKDDSEAQAVKTFAHSFWEKGDVQRTSYMLLGVSDNHSLGRRTWSNFVRDHWNRDWKIDEAIMNILVEKALDPYSCMRRMKSPKVGKPFPIISRNTSTYRLAIDPGYGLFSGV